MHFRLQSFVREKIVVPGQVKQITQQHLWSVNFIKILRARFLGIEKVDIGHLLLRKAMDILPRCTLYWLHSQGKGLWLFFLTRVYWLAMLSHGTNPHSHFPLYELFYCIVCTQSFSPSAEDMACQVIQTSGQNFLKAFHISSWFHQ